MTDFEMLATIAIGFDEWERMTGDDMPAYMASSPTSIFRRWGRQGYEVFVEQRHIDAADAWMDEQRAAEQVDSYGLDDINRDEAEDVGLAVVENHGCCITEIEVAFAPDVFDVSYID